MSHRVGSEIRTLILTGESNSRVSTEPSLEPIHCLQSKWCSGEHCKAKGFLSPSSVFLGARAVMTLDAQPSPVPTEQPLLKLCTGQQHGERQQGRGSLSPGPAFM